MRKFTCALGVAAIVCAVAIMGPQARAGDEGTVMTFDDLGIAPPPVARSTAPTYVEPAPAGTVVYADPGAQAAPSAAVGPVYHDPVIYNEDGSVYYDPRTGTGSSVGVSAYPGYSGGLVVTPPQPEVVYETIPYYDSGYYYRGDPTYDSYYERNYGWTWGIGSSWISRPHYWDRPRHRRPPPPPHWRDRPHYNFNRPSDRREARREFRNNPERRSEIRREARQGAPDRGSRPDRGGGKRGR